MIRTAILFVLSLLVFGMSAYAQISVTTANTPSICYNDGTLTVHATGGTAPYTDSILSGPTNPNLTYPIALPAGDSTFINLPHGTFTIRVHDAAGHSGTFTGTVGGTYEFPSDTLYQRAYRIVEYSLTAHTDTIFCDATSGTGRAPFQYAISAVSANSGFGAYQPENFFTHLCGGTYWIRLRDSCGNIFTSSYLLNYNVLTAVNCFNFDSGTASFYAWGGVPPYTHQLVNAYNVIIMSSMTGSFTSIPANEPDGIYLYRAIDSCGVVSITATFSRPQMVYTLNCPFDSVIRFERLNGFAQTPIELNCLNCVPVQTYRIDSFGISPPDTLFTHIVQGHSYYIQYSDACGNTEIDTIIARPLVTIGYQDLSCNTRQFFFINQRTIVPYSEIDSFFYKHDGVWLRSTNGYFNHLAVGGTNDTVIGYMHGGCYAEEQLNSLIGILNGPCLTMHQDSSCQKIWNLEAANPGDDLAETFFLISSANDSIAEYPPGPGNGAYFFNVAPGNYTLISDSGCSTAVLVDTLPPVFHIVSSYVNCSGQPVLTVKGYDTMDYNPNGPYDAAQRCNRSYFITNIYHNGTLAWGPDTVEYTGNSAEGFSNYLMTYYPADTGYYSYRIFYLSRGQVFNDSTGHTSWYNLPTPYDTICPIDTGTVYVTRSTFPFPYVQAAYLCHGVSSGPPMLTIYGGSIPYTVQIAGIDTITMSTNSGIFPTDSVGTYSVIAYDNCGISRSFTFSIIDTCTACGTVSVGAVGPICQGDSAYLTASAQISGGTYSWSPGGATTQSITVSPATSTTYTVTYSMPGCAPVTDTVTVTIITKPIADYTYTHNGLVYQFTDSAAPGSGSCTYDWYFGDGTPNNFTMNPSHTYIHDNTVTVILTVSNPCGIARDTQIINNDYAGIGTELSDHVSVYPNPSQGSFTIAVDANANTVMTAEVTDMIGRNVYKQPIHSGENKVDLNLAAGVYLVKVSDGGSYAVRVMSIE